MRKLNVLIAVVIAFALVAASPYLAAQQPPGLARAIDVQQRNTPALLNLPGIVGTGVGVNPQGIPVIRVYVQTPGVGAPPNLENIPVERVVTGLLFAGSSNRTIANQIENVLNYFNVSIDDGSGSPPPPGAIQLSVNGYKVRGMHRADLTWSGTALPVDIYRNGTVIFTAGNNSYTDVIGPEAAPAIRIKCVKPGPRPAPMKSPSTSDERPRVSSSTCPAQSGWIPPNPRSSLPRYRDS
jgi:hypothetical protein